MREWVWSCDEWTHVLCMEDSLMRVMWTAYLTWNQIWKTTQSDTYLICGHVTAFWTFRDRDNSGYDTLVKRRHVLHLAVGKKNAYLPLQLKPLIDQYTKTMNPLPNIICLCYNGYGDLKWCIVLNQNICNYILPRCDSIDRVNTRSNNLLVFVSKWKTVEKICTVDTIYY
jgi:hypothetical protein